MASEMAFSVDFLHFLGGGINYKHENHYNYLRFTSIIKFHTHVKRDKIAIWLI